MICYSPLIMTLWRWIFTADLISTDLPALKCKPWLHVSPTNQVPQLLPYMGNRKSVQNCTSWIKCPGYICFYLWFLFLKIFKITEIFIHYYCFLCNKVWFFPACHVLIIFTQQWTDVENGRVDSFISICLSVRKNRFQSDSIETLGIDLQRNKWTMKEPLNYYLTSS